MGVCVRTILDRKGTDVFLLEPDATVLDAIRFLRKHNVGALVVSRLGTDVAGILSERDIVRRLARDGLACLEGSVRDIMTTDITTCRPDQTTEELMAIMTASRIRHVPVIDGGMLTGLVSIGDIVKSYVDELEVRADMLADYVTGSAY